MFILDSLMISGIRWALETALTAAEAELHDDSVLREQLLEAEMHREMGEISDQEFRDIEADLLARIREIRERREGGSGALHVSGGQALETTGDSRFHVEASVSGDFHDPTAAPHTTVIESTPTSVEEVTVLNINRPDRSKRSSRSARSNHSEPRTRTTRTSRTSRTARTTRTPEK